MKLSTNTVYNYPNRTAKKYGESQRKPPHKLVCVSLAAEEGQVEEGGQSKQLDYHPPLAIARRA